MENNNRLESIRRLLGQANTLIAQISSPEPNNVTETSHSTTTSRDTSIPTATRTITELRAAFQPYNRESQRHAGRPASRRSVVASREWIRRFVCLHEPTVSKVPSAARLFTLNEEGLGGSVVTTDTACDGLRLATILRETFPKLASVEFELLKSIGGGAGSPLQRIHRTLKVPGVSTLLSHCRGIVYIRPELEILVENEHQALDTMQDETPTPTSNTQMEWLPANASSSSSAGGTYENGDRTDILDDTEGNSSMVTLSDFRNSLYLQTSERQRIDIARENFLEELFGIYKAPSFKFHLKPQIKFVGEAGTDIGALTKEFFWKGMLSLIHDKIDGKSLFEGETDHRVPTVDCRLLRCGAFKTAGLFMGHAIIHCGLGFLGLSEAVVEYITQENVDSDTPITITSQDVPDLDSRESLRLVTELKRGATLNDLERRSIQETAQSVDFHDVVTFENAAEVLEQVLYHEVIERRKPYLDALKNAIKHTGVLEYLIQRPYLSAGAFPRSNDLIIPTSLIIDKIECTGDAQVFQFVKTYIDALTGENIQKLLSAWTGWPIIPEQALKILIEDECEFKAQTCFQEIQIPSSFTETDVITSFNLLLEYHEGFGSI